MKNPKQPQIAPTKETLMEWSQTAQVLALESLLLSSGWRPGEVAFHGGTSLHLSWNSPRHSEDLDFLLSREVRDLDRVMDAVERRVGEHFLAIHPDFKVEVVDKTRNADRMPEYALRVSRKGYLGKALVKMEFWKVAPEFLRDYPIALRSPMLPGEVASTVSSPVPAADLTAAFADKLTAFATRRALKWRDIYDLWWIGTQTRSGVTAETAVEPFLKILTAYNLPEGLDAPQALLRFADIPRSDLVEAANADLRTWLRPELWSVYERTGAVADMVDYVQSTLRTVASEVRQSAGSATPSQKSGVRRGP